MIRFDTIMSLVALLANIGTTSISACPGEYEKYEAPNDIPLNLQPRFFEKIINIDNLFCLLLGLFQIEAAISNDSNIYLYKYSSDSNDSNGI